MRKTLLGVMLALAGLGAADPGAAGNGALLGVYVEYPRINVTGTAAQGASYDLSNLTLTSTPVFVTFTNGGTAEFVMSGSLTLTAAIDAGGSFSSGSFSISGDVTDTATSTSYSGVLLAGSVLDYGIVDIGGTDLADFRLSASSGSMKSAFDAIGPEIGLVVALEGSTFAGSFATTWTAARVKGDAGPIPGVTPQPPHTIGYWKNHPEAWPITTMTICGSTLNQSDLISVLGTPTRGDTTIIMAKQLIAARLNVAVGNSCPLTSSAESWLCAHGGIGASRKQWDGGEDLKDALDTFNNGSGNCTL